MKKFKLEDFTRGWVVGNFDPAIWNTTEYEVAVQKFLKGDHPCSHYHLLADEITIVVSGRMDLNGTVYGPGDIILIEKTEEADPRFLEDTTTVVIKNKSVPGDKYNCT
jgi:anti-sigma factor ChrR (cupin superfamily)